MTHDDINPIAFDVYHLAVSRYDARVRALIATLPIDADNVNTDELHDRAMMRDLPIFDDVHPSYENAIVLADLLDAMTDDALIREIVSCVDDDDDL